MTGKYLPNSTTQKKIPNRIIIFFRGGGAGEGGEGVRFALKTGIDFAYRVWFSRELRECMNVFIILVLNDCERKKNMPIRNGF